MLSTMRFVLVNNPCTAASATFPWNLTCLRLAAKSYSSSLIRIGLANATTYFKHVSKLKICGKGCRFSKQ